jgi:hypothetical protein
MKSKQIVGDDVSSLSPETPVAKELLTGQLPNSPEGMAGLSPARRERSSLRDCSKS